MVQADQVVSHFLVGISVFCSIMNSVSLDGEEKQFSDATLGLW